MQSYLVVWTSEALCARLDVARLETLRVSPALGVHVGPAVIGSAVMPLNTLEGLL